MPTKPLKQCARPGCARTAEGNYCAEHLPVDERANSAARGYGHRWRKRRVWWLNQHPLCERCEAQDVVRLATDVHHRKPLNEGGADDESNYESLCHECHSAETRRHMLAKRNAG